MPATSNAQTRTGWPCGGSNALLPERWVTPVFRGITKEKLLETVKFFVAPKTLGGWRLIDFLWFLLNDKIHNRRPTTNASATRPLNDKVSQLPRPRSARDDPCAVPHLDLRPRRVERFQTPDVIDAHEENARGPAAVRTARAQHVPDTYGPRRPRSPRSLSFPCRARTPPYHSSRGREGGRQSA